MWIGDLIALKILPYLYGLVFVDGVNFKKRDAADKNPFKELWA